MLRIKYLKSSHFELSKSRLIQVKSMMTAYLVTV